MRNPNAGFMGDFRFSKTIGNFIVVALLIGVCLTIGIRPAQAQLTTYTLSGVTFTDTGTASGYFDFNPTTGLFGPYDIVTTTTSSYMGSTYTGSGVGVSGNSQDVAFFGPHSSEFFIWFDTLLAPTGSSVLRPGAITSSTTTMSTDELTQGTVISTRTLTAGEVIASPSVVSAPEPSEILILCLGLGGLVALGAVSRKRSLPLA